MPIMIDFRNKEEWARIAKKYDATKDEVAEVAIRLTMRGATGRYEEELKQLDRGPYSNEPNQWWEEKIREILAEIRLM